MAQIRFASKKETEHTRRRYDVTLTLNELSAKGILLQHELHSEISWVIH